MLDDLLTKAAESGYATHEASLQKNWPAEYADMLQRNERFRQAFPF